MSVEAQPLAVRAADRPVLCHINLAHSFRGGERQTELLVRGLAPLLGPQLAIVRAGRPLAARLQDIAGVTVVQVPGRVAAVRAAAGAGLAHAHETGGAQAACVRNLISAVPYLITRRVDNVPKSDPFTRMMYRRAAGIAAISSAVTESLLRYDQRLRLRMIPSAASCLPYDEAGARALREQFHGKFLVGHVAALDIAHKGQLALIEAAARLANSQPDVHFIVVGSGKDERTIRAAARGLPNMTFAGWTDKVGDYLAAFDLFAFPSKREGLGSILIDAMQFGLPIVATAVGGIPDLVTDGENGVLISEDDSAALAAAIVRLRADRGSREAMARANRARAAEYAPEIMTRRYLDLYGELAPGLFAVGA